MDITKLTRKLRTHNTYFEKLEVLVDAVARQHTVWNVPNETLRSLKC